MTLTKTHENGNWLMHDSLNNASYLKRIKTLLVELANAQKAKGGIEVYTVNMQQQEGVSDCGLFAIA